MTVMPPACFSCYQPISIPPYFPPFFSKNQSEAFIPTSLPLPSFSSISQDLVISYPSFLHPIRCVHLSLISLTASTSLHRSIHQSVTLLPSSLHPPISPKSASFISPSLSLVITMLSPPPPLSTSLPPVISSLYLPPSSIPPSLPLSVVHRVIVLHPGSVFRVITRLVNSFMGSTPSVMHAGHTPALFACIQVTYTGQHKHGHNTHACKHTHTHL